MAATTTPVRIGPGDNGRAMTLAELQEAEVEDGYRYELARGVLEVAEVPGDPHGDVVANLFDAISRYRRDHRGFVRRYGGGSEFRFWLPKMVSGRNPDLGVVLHDATKDHRGRRIAALAAEVVSTTSVKSRLRDKARGIPRLRLARILDRRSPEAPGDRVDSSRRHLERSRRAQRPGHPQRRPARIRHNGRRALDRRRERNGRSRRSRRQRLVSASRRCE